MSMPQIPKENFRPNLHEVLIDLLKSIALEETAISNILNSEGEINQIIVKKLQCCKDEKSIKELNKSMKQTEKILNTVMMKEWLLLKKMETVGDIKELLKTCSSKNKHCDCDCDKSYDFYNHCDSNEGEDDDTHW